MCTSADDLDLVKAVPTNSCFGFSLYLKFDVFKKKHPSQGILAIPFTDVRSLPFEFPKSKRFSSGLLPPLPRNHMHVPPSLNPQSAEKREPRLSRRLC